MKLLTTLCVCLFSFTMVGCNESTSETASSDTTQSSFNLGTKKLSQASTTSSEVTQTSFNADNAPTVKFSVPGMHCTSCKAKIEEVLAEVDGVLDVSADPDTKLTILAIAPEKFSPEAVIAVLDDYQFTDSTLQIEQ